MNDQPTSVPAPASSGLLAKVMGDLAQIPGAIGAIGRLVGKSAQLGEAWLDIPVAEGQRRAQAIRDDQAARSAMLDVVQKAAAGQAVTDPALLERAISSFVDDRLRKQTNREKVAEKVIDELRKEPPPADSAGPSDDWMNIFEEHAGRASSDELRSLWARILSGEIRKQGSYSLRTVQFISILDRNLASEIETLGGFVVNDGVIPGMDFLNEGNGYVFVTSAVTCGLLMPNSQQILNLAAGTFAIKLGRSHCIMGQLNEQRKIPIMGYTLTTLGREVFNLLNRPADQLLLEHYAVTKSQIFGENSHILPVFR